MATPTASNPRGSVDFTTMYVTHDAFTRDLRRIIAACERGTAFTPPTRAGWATFSEQLQVHHRTEDAFLWPRLRAQPLQPDDVRVLDAMETEHADIDPHLERVEDAFAEGDAAKLIHEVRALLDGLSAHLRHEENAALPLIEAYLGVEGWAAVGRDMSQAQGGGLSGVATYLTWVLDDAPAEVQSKVLGLLPPPMRDRYHQEWAPAYQRTKWWDGAPEA